MGEAADLAVLPAPALGLVGAEAGFDPGTPAVELGHVPAGRQVGQHDQRLGLAGRPDRDHAGGAPAGVLDDLPARLPAPPRAADPSADQLPQRPLPPRVVSDPDGPVGLEPDRPVPAAGRDAVDERRDVEGAVGRHHDRHAGRQQGRAPVEHAVDVAPVRPGRQRGVLLPDRPGQRRAGAPVRQARPAEVDAVILAALVDRQHHPPPAAGRRRPVDRLPHRRRAAGRRLQPGVAQRPPQPPRLAARARRGHAQCPQLGRHLGQHAAPRRQHPGHQQRQPGDRRRPQAVAGRRGLDLRQDGLIQRDGGAHGTLPPRSSSSPELWGPGRHARLPVPPSSDTPSQLSAHEPSRGRASPPPRWAGLPTFRARSRFPPRWGKGLGDGGALRPATLPAP